MTWMQNLLKPPAGMKFDFTQPIGDPSLASPGGVLWRVVDNPISAFIGGTAAVLLELAQPSVRSGVWDHSNFRTAPLDRIRRTAFSAQITIYGAQSKARDEIARVVRIHEHVTGTTPDGTPYRANNPRLLDWVQATATFGFAEAYHRFAGGLSPAERDAAFAEGQPAAQLFGATGAPRSWAEWGGLVAEMAPELEGSDILDEFVTIMNEAPIMPRSLRWLQRLLIRAAVDITPEPVRSFPQLHGKGLRFGERFLIKILARAVFFIPRGETPAVQASRRVGII